MTEIYTMTVPAHWASPLINGDYSGVEDEQECERIEQFERKLLPGNIVGCSETDEFRTHSVDTPSEPAGMYCEITVMEYSDD